MATSTTSPVGANQRPTVREMLTLWLPLAASIAMMALEPSIINMGLGRTTEPELALAAFGVAFSMALLIEAPVFMILDASVARSIDREAFAVVRRFTLMLGFAVTGVGLAVSLSPLYGFIVEGLMNIPADVAARARTTLQILSFWPLPVAWRRAHQGVLIRAGRTSTITAATGVRLCTLAGALVGGLLLHPDKSAVVAGLAMVLSASVEAALVTPPTVRVLRAGNYGTKSTDDSGRVLTPGGLWTFYLPLIATTLIRQATRPVLNAGIAAAAFPPASLAAWPVTSEFVILITGPAWSLQQLTTALADSELSFRRVVRFALGVSVMFSVLLGLVAFSPIYGLVMGGVFNLSSALQNLAKPALQVIVILPLLLGAQAVLRGALIRRGRTSAVRTATMVSMLTLFATVLIGVKATSATGVMLAAFATLLGSIGELAWLLRERRR